ncbi:MAG: T9SS type A sorting domain-containing protein [Bacteroidota bacterium]|nr:T9SS type A sorting domain-containing protein [Bacteroidota bacterium]
MKKLALLIIATFFVFTAYSAFLKNVPVDLKQPDGSASYTISLSKIIRTAMEAVNSFEDYREFPATISSGDQKYPIQQLLKVYADAILAINENGDSIFTINNNIEPPSDLYIKIELDSAVYENPMLKSEYLSLCSQLQQELSGSIQLPNLIDLRNSQIRTVELVYLLASVIRYYHFYNQLPALAQIMITPKGIVPWELSQNKRIYTSMNSGSKYLATNNMYNVGKYETYKIGKKIIGNETNPYNAGKRLFDHVIDRWMNKAGYYLWIKPFGEPDYAYSNYRFNRSNSASQQDKINMLIRSVGLPCTDNRMYDDNSNKWINIDVHKPFGDEPYGFDETQKSWDYARPLEKESLLVNKIKDIISNNNNSDIQEKYIWINSSDVSSYGADYILTKCKSAGINNIILTIKSSHGNLYYPSNYNIGDYTYYMVPIFKFDAITPLTSKAECYGIKIFPAINILHDDIMSRAGRVDPQFGPLKEGWWYQYFVDETNLDKYLNETAISPCIESYKNQIIKYLKELTYLPGVSGIVLSSLYMETQKYKTNTPADYKNVPDGNPNCNCCWNDSLWQSKLLQKYAIDLISAIKSENKNTKVILSSFPIVFSPELDFEGMQDKELMKNLADAYLLPVGYTQWLIPEIMAANENPPKNPDPFLLEDYIKKVSLGAEKPIIVSLPVKDEWIYTPDFYTGLSKKMIRSGASSVCFHDFNSLDGEWGPTFDAFQYNTISSLNFKTNIENKHPVLEADEYNIDFGKINIGESKVRKLRISNIGQGSLVINGLAFSDSAFSSIPIIKNLTIKSFDNKIIDIYFTPKKNGILSVKLLIKTDFDSILVNLYGEGLLEQVNKSPIANAGSNQTVNEGATVILDGSNSSDPDNNTLIYKWTYITSQDIQNLPNSPEAFIKYSPNGLETKIVKEKEGTKAFLTLSASDDKSHVFTFSDKNLQFIVVSFSKAEGSKSIQFPAPAIGSYEFVVDGTEKGTLVIESILSSTTVANPTFIAPEVKNDSILTFSLLVNDGMANSTPATVKVTVLNVIKVGVSTLDSQFFKVFPNPTTGIVNLEFTQSTGNKTDISVSSMVGVEIFRKEITDAAKFQIDLSNQASGIYMLKVISGNQQYISKIVVRKE